MSEIKKVYLNVCSRRSPEWGMIVRANQAMQYAAEHGISVSMAPRVGESLICRARNNSLVDYMDTDAGFLMTLDDDVEIPKDTIVKLVNNDKDICAGFYRLKNKGEAQTAVRMDISKKETIPDFPTIFKENLLIPAKYVSTGCMIVKRKVLEDMIDYYRDLHYIQNITRKPAWALYQPYIHESEYLSEDWAFCQRAEDREFEVWADGSIRCAHWGLIKYDFGDEGE